MDAAYFRYRAQRAREMARAGEDPRLTQMLLEVALEMEAEAELIESQAATKRNMARSSQPVPI